jgi:hypothetical protein
LFGEASDLSAQAARVCAQVKFILVGAGLACVLGDLIQRGMAWRRRRT